MSHDSQATSSCAETRQRLLSAASIVFAEAGYYEATVREICRRAGANIAAVNYHFGDKEQLYQEVMRSGARQADEKYPMTRQNIPPDWPPERRLQAYILTLMKRIFDLERVATHGKLMAREMIEPTPALAILMDEIFRPLSDLLFEIIGDMLGPAASEHDIRMCASSVVGQCVYYKHCRPMLTQLHPQQCYEMSDIEDLACHITRFSLAALRDFAQGRTEAN